MTASCEQFLCHLKAGQRAASGRPRPAAARRPPGEPASPSRPGVRSTPLSIPALTPRGFWIRAVVFTAIVVAYLWAALLMAREYASAVVLPRRLRRLAHGSLATGHRPHPSRQVEPEPSRAGRPAGAYLGHAPGDNNGQSRSPTVHSARRLTWANALRLTPAGAACGLWHARGPELNRLDRYESFRDRGAVGGCSTTFSKPALRRPSSAGSGPTRPGAMASSSPSDGPTAGASHSLTRWGPGPMHEPRCAYKTPMAGGRHDG